MSEQNVLKAAPAAEGAFTAAVITVSDRCSRGERTDTAGPGICRLLESSGYAVISTALVPDEEEPLRGAILQAVKVGAELILTVGGTGFAKRDITPEVTEKLIEKRVPGIPEAMRAESLKITPRGCLSRSTAGILGGSLIINLPGSEKASAENLQAVIGVLPHALKVLRSEGSMDCAQVENPCRIFETCPSFSEKNSPSGSLNPCRIFETCPSFSEENSPSGSLNPCRIFETCPSFSGKNSPSGSLTEDNCKAPGTADPAEAPAAETASISVKPSLDAWLSEAQKAPTADRCGMYLTHVGVVRSTARAEARQGVPSPAVTAMLFDYDPEKAAAAEREALSLPGIFYVKTWLNRGRLQVGDPIMQVLVGGDIRPHVIEALGSLVGALKNNCVTEREVY